MKTTPIICAKAPVKVNPVPAIRYNETMPWRCSYCGRVLRADLVH